MKRFLALIAVAVVVACGTADTESVGSSASGLVLPDGAPQPKKWDGSAVDLMVADAWAGCAFVNQTKMVDVGNVDGYLSYVLFEINNSLCSTLPNPPSNPLERWYATRQESSCNTNGAGKDEAYTIPSTALFGFYDGSVQNHSSLNDAVDDIIRKPSIDLCIAHRLRAVAPGGAGVSTLTLSGAEQRELAEMTRQRAQLAVLGYDALWQLAAAPRTNSPNPTTVMETVQAVLDQDGNPLGDQFADAMQLLTVTTDEVLELYLRSASARIPRTGNTPASQPADAWGNGSWRSRAFAALYGGDPLAPVAYGETLPWPYFNGLPSVPWTLPFVATDVREPQVDELLQYARRYDVVDLRTLPAPPGGCYEVDFSPAANRLYRAVEAGLRTDGCEQVAQNACVPVGISAIPDPSLGVGDFLLWKEHRISLDHAGLLVRQLAEQIGRKCDHEGQIYETVGAAKVLGQPSMLTVSLQGNDNGDYYHIDKNGKLQPHTDLAEYEGAYGGGGFTTIGSAVADADATLQEYPASDFVWETRRQAGTVRTLAATRRVLDLAKTSPTTPNLLSGHLNDLLDLTAASAGTTSVSYEPVTGLAGVPARLAILSRQAVVYAPADDPFWNPAQATDFTLLIIQDDRTKWVSDGDVLIPALLQETSFRGFTGIDLTDRLTHLFGSSSGPSVVAVPGPKAPLERWTFSGFPASGMEAGYMLARKGSGASAEYRLIAGPIAGDSFHGSFGGSLNEVAARSIVPQAENEAPPSWWTV